MQLERIHIKNLFGRFNYDIHLTRPEKITIIHAPNGYGKTVLLTLVHAFFTQKFEVFFKYQFQELILFFDDGEVVAVRKAEDLSLFPHDQKDRIRTAEVTIIISSANEGHEPYRLRTSSDTLADLDDFLPFIGNAGRDRWFDEQTNEIITSTQVVERYHQYLPANLQKRGELPDWLKQLLSSTDCRLIETQRLLRFAQPSPPRRVPKRGMSSRAVVDIEASDLAERIGLNLAEYANSSQSLDQSFPSRVIDALSSTHPPSAEEVSKRLEAVERKRSALIQAGLLDKSGAPDILSQAQLRGDQVRRVMGVYLEDMEQKLSKFDRLFERASLFQEMVSEKFQFKKVVISRASGIGVITDDDVDILLTDLSSGEQHELVLLYELLFRVRDDALILIDEPELSLHVGWQVRFLPDLQRIQRLKPLQIIMATHSPQIINDRWDLTVELK